MFKDEIQYHIALTSSDLPIEMLYTISSFLDALSLSRLSQVSRSYYMIFKDPPLKVAYFLRRVTKSDYEAVDAMLERESHLLLERGCVKDHCREFENITAFQYALWSFDWQMWNIMLHHFKMRNQLHRAKEQLEALESMGTQHGKYFDMNPLRDALEIYVRYCDSWWTSDKCENYWNHVISPLEKKLPLHLGYKRVFELTQSGSLEYFRAIEKLDKENQEMLIELKQLLAGDHALNFSQQPIKPSFG